MIRSLCVACLATLPFGYTAAVVADEPARLDCSKIVFYPERWEEAGLDFDMLAWSGDHITFLTRPGRYNEKQMRAFVRKLDEGWKTQHELVGKAPALFRHLDGKPTICALPRPNLSCGYGCGYVGSTGIEVAGFYAKDWPAFRANPDTFAHYYFYEMGRNFYVFGDRHSLFTTGYAVFMRYVCMDRLGCSDSDLNTRKTIENCERTYAESEIRFLDAFTNLSADEKGNRLFDRNGRVISPSDQPVMYATAMLKLRKDYGGDKWVKKFLHSLGDCEEFKATDEETAMPQCLNWLVCASVAAGEDLSPVFADRWRMLLTERHREIMKRTNWSNPRLSVAKKVNELAAPETDASTGAESIRRRKDAN